MNRPRVLFFLPDFNGGGAERALLNLLRAWPDPGIQPLLAVRREDGPLRRELPEDVELRSLGLPRSGLRATAATVLGLGRILRETRPFAVVAFLSYPSVVLAAALSGTPARVLASVQNPLWAEAGNGLRRWLSRLCLRACAERTALFLPLVPGIGRQISEELDVPPSRIEILPNSVDLKRIRALKDEAVTEAPFTGGGRPVVVSACRLTYQKNVDVLIEAVAALDVDLAILGTGPERDRLERKVEGLGLRSRVFFLGFQANPWKYIAKASVFALASRYEGFGNVLAEAMACGVPVVSTRAPFGPEYILNDGRCGLLVPPGDATSLAAALRLIIGDPALRRTLAREGEARSRDFDAPAVAARFVELLRRHALEGGT